MPDQRFGTDIGEWAVNKARIYRQSGQILWAKEQVVNGTVADFVMRDDETLEVAFAGYYANFTATKLKTKQDVVEVMLMLLTYDADKGFGGK